MTTAYLPDISHRSIAPKWLAPSDLPERLEGAWVQARYDEIIAACEAAGDDAEAWIEIVLRTSEFESFLGSHGSRTGVAYRQDTEDAAVTAEYERWNREISPVISDASVVVARHIVESPAAAAIDERFGVQFLKLAANAVRAHDPVNTALGTELSDVLMRHTRIFGKGTIQWRGETHPLSFARKAALDEDRDERHAAWQSKVDYVEAHAGELQEIYDEAFALRAKMAENLGQPSYVDLRYLEMSRFDWNAEDAAQVRGAIERHLVPLASALQQLQADALGTDKLHPADEEIQPVAVPQPIVGIDEQLVTAASVFASMGEAFGAPFRMLVDEDLIDLPARPGKGTGAFCTSFPFERVPFIFCNSVGSHDDIITLTHEYGHALQGWRSRDIEPIDLQHPTMEACEIHSMTLELLVLPYCTPFFGDGLAEFSREHVKSTLTVVPYMAAIDEFQHRVFEEELDAEGRAAAWRDAAQRFQPALDWGANEFYGGNRWLFQLHVFQSPFYYLDYALARIVSWELWLNSLEDEAAALESYLTLCSLGGTKPFRELVREAGLGDPFDEAVIERTMTRLRPHLGLD
ncbi:MAG: oligoendopeptidase [Thermoleophilia bacterium]|nr:oligoendopeptidase [Thermoleophilia bacterium]